MKQLNKTHLLSASLTLLLPFMQPSKVLAEEAKPFNIGFNQAWIHSNYEKQWSDKYYDPAEVKRILDLTKNAGSKVIRMWLFEGPNPTGLIWTDGKVSSISPEFLKNFEDFLKEAKKRDLQVYPTYFAVGSLEYAQGDQPTLDRWWNLINDKFGGREAFLKASQPLVDLMYSPEYRSSIFGVDVSNEIDAGVILNAFENSWYGVNKFVCAVRDHIRKGSPSGQDMIPVTASLGWPYIPIKSRGANNIILDPNPHPNCVDFWDIHLYNNGGTINHCEEIKALIKKHNKKIYLGEFGQFSKAFDDKLQLSVNKNFIKNAKKCGFSGALGWRLSDVRPGHNTEARHSYEAFGKTRPAYEFVKGFNENEARMAEASKLKKEGAERKIASKKDAKKPKK